MKYICTLLACILASCSSSQEAQKPEGALVPVFASTPTIADVPVYVESLGTLRPTAFVEVRSRINGMLTHVHVQDGQWVEEGMCLFQVDSRQHEIKVQACQAQVASDRATLAAALKKQERFKTLADKSLISQNEWDQIETDVFKAKANLDLAQTKLKEAHLDLEHCQICAKKAGRVGKVDIHPGHIVDQAQETPLACISCMDPLFVEFSVTEKEFCQLTNKAKEFEIALLSSPETLYKGTLSFTDNHFDDTTGQILLRGKIANEQYKLRPGMSVRVRVPVGTLSNAMLICQRAVKYNQFGAFVLVVQQDGTVALRQVHVGAEYGNDVIITDGLKPDDVIITEGHQRAIPGTKVEIKS